MTTNRLPQTFTYDGEMPGWLDDADDYCESLIGHFVTVKHGPDDWHYPINETGGRVIRTPQTPWGRFIIVDTGSVHRLIKADRITEIKAVSS